MDLGAEQGFERRRRRSLLLDRRHAGFGENG
jgi:hypothetical protein